MINPKPKRAKSEADFTETEAQMDILNELPIGICRADLRGTIKCVNKHFEELTGYTRDEVVGKNALKMELFPDDMRRYLLKRIAARIAGAVSKKVDTQLKCKDGSWIWVSLKDAIVRKSGVPVGFQIIASDITERKRAEEALREKEEIFNQFMAASPELVYIKDEKHRFYKLSKSFEDLFGKPSSELIGKDLYDLLPLELAKVVYEDDLKVIQGGIKVNAEEKLGDVYFSSIKFPIHRGPGKLDYLGGYSIDITKRKQAEEALKESEKLYHSLFDNMLNGFAYCQIHFDDEDKPCDFTYLAVNSAFESQTGLKNVIGKKVTEVIPGFQKTDQKLLDIYGRVAKNGQPECFEMFVESLKMWFSVSVYSPKTGYFVSVFDVITERKQAEEALRESEAKYRLMVESSRDAIIIRQNDRFIFVNDAFASMLGYQKEEILQSDFKKVYTDKSVKMLAKLTKQRSNGEVVADRYETVFLKKDGTEVDVEANVRMIDYKGQKATFAVIRDITKQKEIMATMQASAGQSKGLKNLIPICAGCNKIRDDDQKSQPWVSPVVYISDRLPNINFSHGMCPDCMQKWYPDYVAEKDTEERE